MLDEGERSEEARFEGFMGDGKIEVLSRRKNPSVNIATGDRQMIERIKTIKEADDAGFVVQVDNIAGRSRKAVDGRFDFLRSAGGEEQIRPQFVNHQGDGKADAGRPADHDYPLSRE
jgi:hypothetical protein